MLLCIAALSLTVSFICYFLIICKIRSHIRGAGASLNTGDLYSMTANIKLAIFGLIMFVILFFFILYAYSMSVVDPTHNMECYMVIISMYCVITDVFGWINPYLIILMSSLVRKHMFMVLCHTVQERQQVDDGSNQGIELMEFPLVEQSRKRLNALEKPSDDVIV